MKIILTGLLIIGSISAFAQQQQQQPARAKAAAKLFKFEYQRALNLSHPTHSAVDKKALTIKITRNISDSSFSLLGSRQGRVELGKCTLFFNADKVPASLNENTTLNITGYDLSIKGRPVQVQQCNGCGNNAEIKKAYTAYYKQQYDARDAGSLLFKLKSSEGYDYRLSCGDVPNISDFAAALGAGSTLYLKTKKYL